MLVSMPKYFPLGSDINRYPANKAFTASTNTNTMFIFLKRLIVQIVFSELCFAKIIKRISVNVPSIRNPALKAKLSFIIRFNAAMVRSISIEKISK